MSQTSVWVVEGSGKEHIYRLLSCLWEFFPPLTGYAILYIKKYDNIFEPSLTVSHFTSHYIIFISFIMLYCFNTLHHIIQYSYHSSCATVSTFQGKYQHRQKLGTSCGQLCKPQIFTFLRCLICILPWLICVLPLLIQGTMEIKLQLELGLSLAKLKYKPGYVMINVFSFARY